MARVRSPAYPSMPLREAVEIARGVHSDYGGPGMHPVNVVHGIRTLSALKQYGIILVQGKGTDAFFMLTDRALKLIMTDDFETRRECGLSPRIHKVLWDRFDGRIDDQRIEARKYLLNTEGYNEKIVDDLLDNFINTLKYIDSGDSLPSGFRITEDRLQLGDFSIVVRRPKVLSKESYDELKGMFQLMLGTAKKDIQ